jgi:uncharacterized repeat protein (TIGR01451 family)
MLSLCMAGMAEAQFRGPRITISLSDALVDLPKGRKAERDDNGNLLTQPGDIIRYTLVAENIGTEQARDVEVVDPIPFGTEYVLGSATGRGTTILYSINGGTTYVDQPMIEVRDETGKMVRKPAPASMYTHVKWIIQGQIMPREKRTMELRVRVLSG